MIDSFGRRSFLAVLAAWALVAVLATPGLARAPRTDSPTSPPGPSLDLTAHRGRVVIVDFWASWCRPCRSELPWLDRLQRELGPQGLTVLTVNLDREREPAQKLLAGAKVDLPVIYDPQGDLAREHAIEGMPTSLFYGRDGALRSTHLGFEPQDEAKLQDEIQQLLAEPAPSAAGEPGEAGDE